MEKKENKVGIREKLGFMSFSASTNIVFNFKSTYYKYFLTSILLIDPIAASNMALIGTVWDIVNDPLIGVWANNITEAEIRTRTKSDPHSLGRFRVNGALPHIDMWYDAFDVKEGDKLFVPKTERLPLW